MYKKHKNNGFTLIEIIAVLIILGILAAVATPKFINMQREARIAKLEEMRSTMLSAFHMMHAKAELLGIEPHKKIEKNNPEHNAHDLKGDIRLHEGYPAELKDVLQAINLDEELWQQDHQFLMLKSAPNKLECGIVHITNSVPQVIIVTDGC